VNCSALLNVRVGKEFPQPLLEVLLSLLKLGLVVLGLEERPEPTLLAREWRQLLRNFRWHPRFDVLIELA